jgi:lysophospholipase L1-like esterase
MNFDIIFEGDMISDGVHPNNVGYSKMAQVWKQGLNV